MSLPKLKDGTKLRNFVIIKELGAGCFGRVYEAINTTDNNTVAIKCVSKMLAKSSPKAYELFQAERTILAKINNENVVGFIDYFESKDVCFLCLEYCNEGDLEIYLKNKPGNRVPEAEAIEYFKQILNGFRSLHENNILHRDIKLPNILKNNGQLKIADLGFAKELNNGRQLTGTVLGTPYTMAPEVLEEKPYGLPCDIYSIGVNLYQILYGVYPFNGRSEFELVNNIKQQKILFNNRGVQVSKEMTDLLTRMLKYSVQERITMEEICNHPILKEEKKNYNNMGWHDLHASKIDLNRNKDFYKNLNQQKQNQNKPDNPFANIQKGQENPFIIDETESPSNNTQKIVDSYKQKKEIDREVKDTINQYLKEINTVNQIGRCVHSSHVLPETGINTFYPVFFMLKKLIHQQRRVLNDMEKKANVFKCQYPEQLFSNPIFMNMQNDLKEKLEMNSMYFMARKYDMEDLMAQTPNPDIVDELNEQFTMNTEKFFKQTMINYYINLDEEKQKHLKTSQIKQATQFQCHIVEVLDCLDLDHFFRSQPQFNFEQYQQIKENMSFQEREEFIKKKGEILFKK